MDASLGRSRGNLYLAVKAWACYLGLERIFKAHGKDTPACICREQALRILEVVRGAAGADGLLPASIEADAGFRIIPVVEGLVYLPFSGRSDVFEPASEHHNMVRLLCRHLQQVLQPGCCLFADGTWRLTTGNINSWLSKIYLCQHIARRLLGIAVEATGVAADRAHEAWLKSPGNAYWAWSDQFYSGVAKGSRYYPRGVTSVLWLTES